MKIWAARDKDGALWLYFKKKPIKNQNMWYNLTDDDFCEADEDIPSVKWEDKEPTEVEYDKVTNKLKLK